jgi:hypothetical protein
MTDEVMDYDEASLIGINGVKSGTTSLVICLLSMAREVWVPARRALLFSAWQSVNKCEPLSVSPSIDVRFTVS